MGEGKKVKPVKQIRDTESGYEDLSFDMIDSLIDSGFICMEHDFICEFIDDIEGDIRQLDGSRGDWLNPDTHIVLHFV